MLKSGSDTRMVAFLEIAAAGPIFLIVGIVLFMVFSYRPG